MSLLLDILPALKNGVLLLEDGESVPEATRVENWLADPDYVSVAWTLVDADVTRLMGKAEKINLTLPSLLIRRID